MKRASIIAIGVFALVALTSTQTFARDAKKTKPTAESEGVGIATSRR